MRDSGACDRCLEPYGRGVPACAQGSGACAQGSEACAQGKKLQPQGSRPCAQAWKPGRKGWSLAIARQKASRAGLDGLRARQKALRSPPWRCAQGTGHCDRKAPRLARKGASLANGAFRLARPLPDLARKAFRLARKPRSLASGAGNSWVGLPTMLAFAGARLAGGAGVGISRGVARADGVVSRASPAPTGAEPRWHTQGRHQGCSSGYTRT